MDILIDQAGLADTSLTDPGHHLTVACPSTIRKNTAKPDSTGVFMPVSASNVTVEGGEKAACTQAELRDRKCSGLFICGIT
jgi:hypothetical protein